MHKDIELFLNSDLNEADYFSLSKDNLITLKDYLLQVKDNDVHFTQTVQEQFQSIKKKCNWLTSISFGGLVHESGSYEITAIYLKAEDGIDIIASYNYKNNRYEGLVKNVPKIYLISGKVRKRLLRQKDIDIIQEELHEIEKNGRDIYMDVLEQTYSISGNFQIHYTPHAELSVYNNYDLIANYFDCPPKHKEKTYLKDSKSKEKLLQRILIKRK